LIGVVLAAGEGSRLRPLTDDRPKSMLEIGGKPLVSWSLGALAALRPECVVLVIGSGRERIVARLGHRFDGIPLQYADQQAPTGSADALLAAESLVGETDVIAVINGDNVFAADLDHVLFRHVADRRDATLLVERLPPESAEQGVCSVEEDGRVSRIVEHPTAAQRRVGVVSAGFYVFRRSPVFAACRRVRPSANGEREIAEAIGLMIVEGRNVGAVWLAGKRVNVNRPEDLERAERLLAHVRGQPRRP
jgi:glucose-1-phosphate thymidylyltransferase